MSGGDDEDWTKEIQKINRDESGRDAHVTHSSNGWSVVHHRGASSGSYSTQRDAIAHAREIVKNAGGGEITIHGKDGSVRGKSVVRPEKHKGMKDDNPPSSK